MGESSPGKVMVETSVHRFQKGIVGIWGAEICSETGMKGLFTRPPRYEPSSQLSRIGMLLL